MIVLTLQLSVNVNQNKGSMYSSVVFDLNRSFDTTILP